MGEGGPEGRMRATASRMKCSPKRRAHSDSIVSAGVCGGGGFQLPHRSGFASSGGARGLSARSRFPASRVRLWEAPPIIHGRVIPHSEGPAEGVAYLYDKAKIQKNRKARYVLADCLNTGSSVGAWVVERLHPGRGRLPPARGCRCHDAVRLAPMVAATGVNGRRGRHLQGQRKRFRFPLPAGDD